jgi:hypothetical protein
MVAVAPTTAAVHQTNMAASSAQLPCTSNDGVLEEYTENDFRLTSCNCVASQLIVLPLKSESRIVPCQSNLE